MRNFFENLIYRCRTALEEHYFYNRRIIKDWVYDDDLYKWERQKKIFRQRAKSVISNWYEGETAVLDMIELKLAWLFYKIKKDGCHAFWYVDVNEKTLHNFELDDLRKLTITGLQKRYLTGKKSIDKYNNSIFLGNLDDFSYYLKFSRSKKGYDIYFETYAMVESDKTIKVFNFNKEKVFQLNAEIQDLKISLLEAKSRYPSDEKVIKDLETKITQLRSARSDACGDYDTIKEKVRERTASIKLCTIEEPSADCIENGLKTIQSYLGENLKDGLCKESLYDLILKDFQTVDITPELYISLSDNVKKICRGQRKDLQIILEARRRLKKLQRHTESNFLVENAKEYYDQKRKLYTEWAEYMSDNFENVWD